MKRLIGCLVMALLMGTAAARAQQQDQQQQQQPGQRPTLGPPGPSEHGPNPSTTTDARRLAHVRAIFVEPMDNHLSATLTAGLAKMGLVRVAAKRSEADAILSGTCFDSRRLRRLHSEVFLSERASRASIWQDVVRLPLYPPPLPKAVDQTAARILEDLSQSIQQAENK